MTRIPGRFLGAGIGRIVSKGMDAPALYNGMDVPRGFFPHHASNRSLQMEIKTIGIDLVKNVFQVQLRLAKALRAQDMIHDMPLYTVSVLAKLLK